MSEELLAASQILGIGMLTVGIVLTLVVGMGKLMIRFINMLPETTPTINTRESQEDKKEISNHHIVAITAAVSALSSGSVSITKIEKMK